MNDWRALVKTGKFAEAEPLMLHETAKPDGSLQDADARAEFYESWGDTFKMAGEAKEKDHTAHFYWATFASWSTSGGEGTARMRDVNRVLEKIESLR